MNNMRDVSKHVYSVNRSVQIVLYTEVLQKHDWNADQAAAALLDAATVSDFNCDQLLTGNNMLACRQLIKQRRMGLYHVKITLAIGNILVHLMPLIQHVRDGYPVE